MKLKFKILIIIGIFVILVGIGTPTYFYFKEKHTSNVKQGTTLKQNIINNITQYGGTIVSDANGNPVIYEPKDFLIVMYDDDNYRHITYWADGIMFGDRQIPLKNETDTPETANPENPSP